MNREAHPLWAEVRRILWAEWDPIGCGVPEDEYDSYVWPVIGKIARGETAEQVADYLDWASNKHMECPQSRKRNLEFANKLIALRTAQ